MNCGPRYVFGSVRAISYWLIAAIAALAITLLAACSSTSSRVIYDSPAWSPDGSKIAFSSNRNGNYEIYVMNSDGTDQTRLSFNSDGDGTPMWSPDGSKLLCTYWGWNSDSKKIYVMNADGSNRISLSNMRAGHNLRQPWSPDSTKIVFTSGGTIYVVNADGSNLTSIAKGYNPIWSPDGSRIAFTSGGILPGNTEDLYIMGADGNSQVKISAPNEYKSLPVWSPDSRRIAYYNTKGIHIINSDGSNYINIGRPDSYYNSPMWSPDGNRIVFSSMATDKTKSAAVYWQVYVLHITSGNVSNLTNYPAYNVDPAWSPDGTRIAFVSKLEGRQGVYVMKADGSNPVKLTR